MINDLINAILKSLENTFPNFNKYVEDVEQGFSTPCFFINLLEYDKENLLESERFLREKETVDLEIIFFPKEEQGKRIEKRQIAEMIPKLTRCVERIELYNKTIRSNNIKAVTVDNTAQVLVSFDFNTARKFKKQFMGRLEHIGGNIIG